MGDKSTTSATSPPSTTPATSSSRGGVYAALRYTGLPESWISRPKLPSRNWLIFIGAVSSLVGAYTYDRKQCQKIRAEYVQRVEHLSGEPMASNALPRKVTVYAAKWPGDDDHSRPLRYFRKYVKPVLVAAAVDYDIVNGKRHGDLARKVSNRITTKRRISAGLEKAKTPLLRNASMLSPEQEAARELAGGSILVGRQTLKEYMDGLHHGWTRGLDMVSDREEEVVRALDSEGDTHFDEPDEPSVFVGKDVDEEPIPTISRLPPAQAFSPLKLPQASPSEHDVASKDSRPESVTTDVPSPSTIPPQPPLLLVPFTNHIGFTQIPLMIWDFFNQRYRVKSGAECAYQLVMNQTRPIVHFTTDPTSILLSHAAVLEGQRDDLDFDRSAESFYKSSLSKFESDVEKARASYYKELSKRLETARALSRGTRDPTKDEEKYPPPTEVELRTERVMKEVKWRGDIEGWQVVRPDREVVWDERFREALRVFKDPLRELN